MGIDLIDFSYEFTCPHCDRRTIIVENRTVWKKYPPESRYPTEDEYPTAKKTEPETGANTQIQTEDDATDDAPEPRRPE